MPVFVTRADHGIGPALVTTLSRDGADVRAFATGGGDVAAVRAAGAFLAVGDLDDEGHLDAAMTDVHTVIVPTATWLADPDELDTEVATIAAAASSAMVRRLVLVSVVGADRSARSGILAAFGRAEDRLADAEMQTLVVRTDGIVEHGFADVAAALDCDGEVAPVRTPRLVAGLAALDAARSGRDDGHALFTALGPRGRLASYRPDTEARPGDARTTGPALVGRRWLAPARRADLQAALCGRGGPQVAGSDLWDFTDGAERERT